MDAGWKPQDAEQDQSWIHWLDAGAVAGFESALAVAMTAGKPLLDMTQDDFPLLEASQRQLRSALDTTQGKWGMCLLKGFPVDRWTEDETRMAYWGMSLYMGVARTQNRASDILNDVRDVGGVYRGVNSRGYNTNAKLDFHTDSCDVVSLLCRRTAKSGGESKVVSSKALIAEFVARRPELESVLREPFYFSYQGAQDPLQPPYYALPLLGASDADFLFRINRRNVIAAQDTFAEVPRLTTQQIEALDLIDELLEDPQLCFSMNLEEGDLQLLNNYVMIHSRTNFEDHEEFDRKRHLLRLWLALPNAQALPKEWARYYGDYRAGSVRGGLRGSSRSQAFEAFERRQADTMNMTRLDVPLDMPESAHG